MKNYNIYYIYKDIYGDYYLENIQKDTEDKCLKFINRLKNNKYKKVINLWLTTTEKII